MDSPREVVWTHSAKHNLRAIHDYIAQNSTEFARHLVDKITNRSLQIARFPLSGRIVPEFGIGQLRELFERPYRIIYHISPSRIEVVALVHMSRRIGATSEEDQSDVS